MVAVWAAIRRHGRSGGRPRPSGGPTRSIAGNTARGPAPMTRPPRRGPLCCGPCCVAAGWSRCAPTPTKPRAGSRRRTSRRRRPRSFKVSRGSSAVTSMPATLTSSDAISIGDVGAPDVLAHALCERSLVAMTRGHWTRAEALADEARTVLRRAMIEDSDATALVSAVQARVAQHRGDLAAARRELVKAQRLRPFLTYAEPTIAVQARIELTRVHLALGDTAGARTLMREIEELLRRRPGLGTLVGEAQALRAQLAKRRGADAPRGVVPDRRRAAPAAVAVDASVVRRTGRRTVRRRRTPSRRTPSRSTASSGPPPAARRSPGPVKLGLLEG